MEDITITMPKWRYDALVSENSKLKKELKDYTYRTYINFRIDHRQLNSIDFPSFYAYINEDKEIPAIIKSFESKLNEVIVNANWVIKNENEKLVRDKFRYMEKSIPKDKKSFWERFWD